MSRYTVHPGKFVCHECKGVVSSLRLYEEDKLLTWMCSSKHLSKVSLQTKKHKRDYERKI
jgi:hypothetical protein